MNKIFILILILNFGLVFGQNPRTTIPQSWYTENPDFKNQGEQEDYWSYKLFRDEYKPSKYNKYVLEIEEVNNNVIRYGVTRVKYEYSPQELKLIFTSGIFYPEILDSAYLNISNLEELVFLSTPRVKRFRFWLTTKGFANPQVFFFELQNLNASESTSLQEFIKGAKLTFVKDGWIII